MYANVWRMYGRCVNENTNYSNLEKKIVTPVLRATTDR